MKEKGSKRLKDNEWYFDVKIKGNDKEIWRTIRKMKGDATDKKAVLKQLIENTSIIITFDTVTFRDKTEFDKIQFGMEYLNYIAGVTSDKGKTKKILETSRSRD